MARIIALLFALLVTFTASAQVVQPVYTRPSKSKVQTLFSLSQSLSGTQTSAVLDTSTFYSIQIQIVYSDLNLMCLTEDTVIVETSDTATGTFIEVDDPGNSIKIRSYADGNSSLTVSSLNAFSRVRVIQSGAGSCAGTTTISAIFQPNPITTRVQGSIHDYWTSTLAGQLGYYPVNVGGVVRYSNGQQPSSLSMGTYLNGTTGGDSLPFLYGRPFPVNDVNVSAGGWGRVLIGNTATLVPGAGRGTALVLQNRSGSAVNCGFDVSVTTPTVDTRYAFTLPAEATKGSSQPYVLDGFNGDLWCIADLANTPIAYYRR